MKEKLFTEQSIETIKNSCKNQICGVELIYKPKDTSYWVKDVVKIKQEDGEWKTGLSYTCGNHAGGKEVYVRELDLFDKDKWDWRMIVGG